MTKYRQSRRYRNREIETSTDYIQIRCKPSEKERWKTYAAGKGLGLGTLIKFLLYKEYNK